MADHQLEAEMKGVVVHSFRACELWIWPANQYLETRFPDGSRAGATRDCELNNLSYAQHLGYPDCWTAVMTHEAAHTLISEGMGHPHSPTLYAVARGYADGTIPYEERLFEEAVVLSVERFMNRGELTPILLHPHVRPYFMRWAEDLRLLQLELLKKCS